MKIPQVKPDWATGIYTGRSVATKTTVTEFKYLTNAEFNALPRYSEDEYGQRRIVDLPLHYFHMTASQKERLCNDDTSYANDLEEEARYLRADALTEFRGD
jgi:hypothetical protein